MRIEFSEDGRDFVRRDWSGLVTADPAGTFFHSPGFLKLYWEEFGVRPEHLLLAFGVDEGGGQVGAVAFERVDGTLRFLGGTEVTDYMGPVAVPEAAGSFAKELLAALLRRDDWTDADLRGLAEDAGWLERLRAAAEAQGLHVEVTADQNGTAPFLPLPGSYQDYLAGLPSKLRHEIRRKARRLESEAGPYRIHVAHEDTLAELLDRFVELHRTSEGPKGVFMQAGMEIFFRRLGEAFLPRGIFNLVFIDVQGEKVAGTIGFRFDGTYYLYNSAFDHRWRHLSPGMVLVAEDIRIAIEGGCAGFDLLKGDYDYKYRFGASPRYIKRLTIRR
ncbi:MAG: GNAT family N-acetyltransferase [Candidatus Velamenicoccus archaeovorus]